MTGQGWAVSSKRKLAIGLPWTRMHCHPVSDQGPLPRSVGLAWSRWRSVSDLLSLCGLWVVVGWAKGDPAMVWWFRLNNRVS